MSLKSDSFVAAAEQSINQSINQSFFYSGLSNLNHCEVHARSTRVLDGRIAAVGMFSNDV